MPSYTNKNNNSNLASPLKKLLDAINNVSKGIDSSVTIYYKDLGTYVHKQDVENALEQWRLFFNSIYNASYTNNRSGNLQLLFELSDSTNKTDIHIVARKEDELTSSRNPSSKMAISYYVYHIGELLGFKGSSLNSPMNPLHVKKNYLFLSDTYVDKNNVIIGNGLITYQELIKDSFRLYGNPSIKTSLVYGCIDSRATNYNPDANTDDGSCQYQQSLLEISSQLKDDTILQNRELASLDIVDPNSLFTLSYNGLYYKHTQVSITGPFHYQENFQDFFPPEIGASPAESASEGYVNATSAIYTDNKGHKLFTIFAYRDTFRILDRFGNLLRDSNGVIVGTLSYFISSTFTQPSETIDFNSNIIAFGDNNLVCFGITSAKNYITFIYVDPTLPNYNSNGQEIVDCEADLNSQYGGLVTLGNVTGIATVRTDLNYSTDGGANYWAVVPFNLEGKYISGGEARTVSRDVDGVFLNPNSRTSPILLTNSFSNRLANGRIEGEVFNKVLIFGNSSEYVVYNVPTQKAQDSYDIGVIDQSNNIVLASGDQIEHYQPYHYDNGRNQFLYNRDLTIGSFDPDSNLVYKSYIKGFSFDDNSLGQSLNFESTIINGVYNFNTSQFESSDAVDNLKSHLLPIVKGNRRQSIISSDYMRHFSSLQEFAPSGFSVENYTDGVYLTAIGTSRGFLILYLTTSGIFLPVKDQGIEIHLPGCPATMPSNIVTSENQDHPTNLKGMRPISACFSRGDNFLIAIVEGVDINDRYIIVYPMQSIHGGDDINSGKAEVIMSDVVMMNNPFTSVLTRVDLDHEGNIIIYGSLEDEQYLRIPNADIAQQIVTAVDTPLVSTFGSEKLVTPSVNNITSVYTNVKHNDFSNVNPIPTGGLTNLIRFQVMHNGLDIYQHDTVKVYSPVDHVIRSYDYLVTGDNLDPHNAYPSLLSFYGTKTPALFTANNELLLYTAIIDVDNTAKLAIMDRQGTQIYSINVSSHNTLHESYTQTFGGGTNNINLTSELINEGPYKYYVRGERQSASLHYFTTILMLPAINNPNTVYILGTLTSRINTAFSGTIITVSFSSDDEIDITPTGIDGGVVTDVKYFSAWNDLMYGALEDTYVMPTHTRISRANGNLGMSLLYTYPDHIATNFSVKARRPLDVAPIHAINLGLTGSKWLMYLNNPNPSTTYTNSSISNSRFAIAKFDADFTMRSLEDWEDIPNPDITPGINFNQSSMLFGEDDVTLEFSTINRISLKDIIPSDYKEAYDYGSLFVPNQAGFLQPVVNKISTLKIGTKRHLAVNIKSVAVHSIYRREDAFPVYSNMLFVGQFDDTTGQPSFEKTIVIEKVISEYLYGKNGQGNNDSYVFNEGEFTANNFMSSFYRPTVNGRTSGNKYNLQTEIFKFYGGQECRDDIDVFEEMYPKPHDQIRDLVEELKLLDNVNYYSFHIKDMIFNSDASILYVLISNYGDWSAQAVPQFDSVINNNDSVPFNHDTNYGFGDRIYKIKLARESEGVINSTEVKEVTGFQYYNKENWPADFEDFFSPHRNLPEHDFETQSQYYHITKMYRGRDGFIYLGLADFNNHNEGYPALMGRIVNEASFTDSTYALGMKAAKNPDGSIYEVSVKDRQFSFSTINNEEVIGDDVSSFINNLIDESNQIIGTVGCTDPAACNYNPNAYIPCQGPFYIPNHCCQYPVGDCPCENGSPTYPYGACGSEFGCSADNFPAWNTWNGVLGGELGDVTEGSYLANIYQEYLQNAPGCLQCTNTEADNGVDVNNLPPGSVGGYPELNDVICQWYGCLDPGACNFDPLVNASAIDFCQAESVGWMPNYESAFTTGASTGTGMMIRPTYVNGAYQTAAWMNGIGIENVHPNDNGSGHETILHCECDGNGGLQPLEGWCGECGTPGVAGNINPFYNQQGEIANPIGIQLSQNYGNNSVYPQPVYCSCDGVTPSVIPYDMIGLSGVYDAQWWVGSLGTDNPVRFCSCSETSIELNLMYPHQVYPPQPGTGKLNVACDCDGNFLGNVPSTTVIQAVCNCYGDRPWDVNGTTEQTNTCDCDGNLFPEAEAAGYCPGCTTANVKVEAYPDLDGDGVAECYDPNLGNPYEQLNPQIIPYQNTGSCAGCYSALICPTNNDSTNPELPPGWASSCGDDCLFDPDECGVCNGPGIPDGDCDCFGNQLDCAGECGGTSQLDQGNLIGQPVTGGRIAWVYKVLDPENTHRLGFMGKNYDGTAGNSLNQGYFNTIIYTSNLNEDNRTNRFDFLNEYNKDTTNEYTDWFIPSAAAAQLMFDIDFIKSLPTQYLACSTYGSDQFHTIGTFHVLHVATNNFTGEDVIHVGSVGRNTGQNLVVARTQVLSDNDTVTAVGSELFGGTVGYIQNSATVNYSLDNQSCCEPENQFIYYLDADGDGLGDATQPLQLCYDNPMTNTGGCVGAGCYVQNNTDDDDLCDGIIDQCGVCNGDNSCLDCAGVPNGTSVEDECGVCYDSEDDPLFNTTCADCAGVPNGLAYADDCGDCVGGTTGLLPNYAQNICGVCDEPDPLPGQCCPGEFFCDCEAEGEGSCLPEGSPCTEDLGCGCGNPAPEDYPCGIIDGVCTEADENGCCPGEVFDFCKNECIPTSNPAAYEQSVPDPCNPDNCVSPAYAESAYACTYCTDPTAINYLTNCDGVVLAQNTGGPEFDSGCCEYAELPPEPPTPPEVTGEVDLVGDQAPYIEEAMVACPATYEECTVPDSDGVQTRIIMKHQIFAEGTSGENDFYQGTILQGYLNTIFNVTGAGYSLHNVDMYGTYLTGNTYTLQNRSYTTKCQIIKNDHKKIYVDNVGYNGEVIFTGLSLDYAKLGAYINIGDAFYAGNPNSQSYSFFSDATESSPYHIGPYYNFIAALGVNEIITIGGSYSEIDHSISPYNILLTDPTHLENPELYVPQSSASIFVYKPQFYFRLDADLELDSYDPNVLFAAYADKIEKVERFTIKTIDALGLAQYPTSIQEVGITNINGARGGSAAAYLEHLFNPTPTTVYNPITGESEILNKGQRYAESLTVGEQSGGNNFNNKTAPVYWVYKVTPKSTAAGVYEEFVIDLENYTPTPEPSIGVCIDNTAVNTGITSTGQTITDPQVLEDIANGTHPEFFANNSLCEYSNCGGVFEQVCCETGFVNSIQNDGLIPSDIGIYGSEHECKVCNANACEPTEICADQSAIAWVDTEALDAAGIQYVINNNLCQYPQIVEGNLRIDVWVNVDGLSAEELDKMEWVIYSTHQNIMLKSPQLSTIDVENNVAHYTVPLIGLAPCNWFLPIGVEGAEVWLKTILQINSGGISNPVTHHDITYTHTPTPGGSISFSAASVGQCTIGCSWSNPNQLITERCTYYLQEDEAEFTNLSLEITTSYIEDNEDAYKNTIIKVIDISTNTEIIRQLGFDHNSTVILPSSNQQKFAITAKTKIGIKVDNPQNYPFKYVLKDEQGNIITTKTIY